MEAEKKNDKGERENEKNKNKGPGRCGLKGHRKKVR